MTTEKPFSFSTIENFDEHIAKSIKGYDDLNLLIVDLARYFIEDNTNVYDIGCSTGKLLTAISKVYAHKQIRCIGIEREGNLLDLSHPADNLTFLKLDITDRFEFTNASVITSIFTLQFIPLSCRIQVLQSIYDGLNVGGAFIYAEKIYSAHAQIQEMMTFLYYDFKSASFTEEEILGKERDLREIMKPLPLEQNIEMLKSVGFRVVDLFWRHFNFVGIVAIK